MKREVVSERKTKQRAGSQCSSAQSAAGAVEDGVKQEEEPNPEIDGSGVAEDTGDMAKASTAKETMPRAGKVKEDASKAVATASGVAVPPKAGESEDEEQACDEGGGELGGSSTYDEYLAVPPGPQ